MRVVRSKVSDVHPRRDQVVLAHLLVELGHHEVRQLGLGACRLLAAHPCFPRLLNLRAGVTLQVPVQLVDPVATRHACSRDVPGVRPRVREFGLHAVGKSFQCWDAGVPQPLTATAQQCVVKFHQRLADVLHGLPCVALAGIQHCVVQRMLAVHVLGILTAVEIFQDVLGTLVVGPDAHDLLEERLHLLEHPARLAHQLKRLVHRPELVRVGSTFLGVTQLLQCFGAVCQPVTQLLHHHGRVRHAFHHVGDLGQALVTKLLEERVQGLMVQSPHWVQAVDGEADQVAHVGTAELTGVHDVGHRQLHCVAQRLVHLVQQVLVRVLRRAGSVGVHTLAREVDVVRGDLTVVVYHVVAVVLVLAARCVVLVPEDAEGLKVLRGGGLRFFTLDALAVPQLHSERSIHISPSHFVLCVVFSFYVVVRVECGSDGRVAQ